MFETAVKEATRLLHIIAAIWLCLIAMTIVVDVFGRYFFNSPLTGTAEIVANSIVAIAFLQIPFAIRTYGMLRTTVVLDHLGDVGRRLFNMTNYLLGVAVFVLMAWASWGPLLNSWAICEYEGEGALHPDRRDVGHRRTRLRTAVPARAARRGNGGRGVDLLLTQRLYANPEPDKPKPRTGRHVREETWPRQPSF